MLRFDHAGARWKRRRVQPAYPQHVQADDSTNHVDERIDLSELMQVRLVGRRIVHHRLGLRKPAEYGTGPLDHCLREAGFLDDMDEVLPASLFTSAIVQLDVDLGAG